MNTLDTLSVSYMLKTAIQQRSIIKFQFTEKGKKIINNADTPLAKAIKQYCTPPKKLFTEEPDGFVTMDLYSFNQVFGSVYQYIVDVNSITILWGGLQ